MDVETFVQKFESKWTKEIRQILCCGNFEC